MRDGVATLKPSREQHDAYHEHRPDPSLG